MSIISLNDINVSISQEPLIQDLKLAKFLGFSRPRKIREIVFRHNKQLKTFGELTTRPTAGRNPTTEYYLNEKQALYLCSKSETPNAVEITIQMVEVFHAVRTGQYQQTHALPDFTKPAVAARAWADEHEAKSDALAQLEIARPKVEALDRLSSSDREPMSITFAAKAMNKGQRWLHQQMQQNNWIRRLSNRWVPFQKEITTGRMTLVVHEIPQSNGETKIVEQPMITPKGLAYYAERLAA